MLETDCWIDRFPEHLKDQAPRMEFRDGGYHITVAGQEIGKRPGRAFDAAALCTAMECNAGLTDIEARLADLDVEGVEKELIFPQRLFSLFILGKMMNRSETFSAYNEHIAEMCAMGKGCLYPVMVPNYWDPIQAKASVERCQELGAHGLMIPIKRPRPNSRVTRGHFDQTAPKTPVVEHVAIARTFATNLCDRENGGIPQAPIMSCNS